MTTPSLPPIDPRAPGEIAPAAVHPMVVPPEIVPAVRGITAFLSSQTRAGDWILPRLFRTVSFMGDVNIDLTKARFGAGVSHIELRVIMGNVSILVPPDVRIENDGDAVIGSFDLEGVEWSAPGPDAPTIRVSGTAFLGSVGIKVIDPNAPSWLDQMRARWAKVRGA